MPARSVVVVVDGLSFVIAETFNWFMGSIGEWYRSQKRRMLLVTQPPNTFVVLNTFFTGKPVEEHGVRGHYDALEGRRARVPYLWERIDACRTPMLVHGVLVTMPPAYVPRFVMPRPWADYTFLPKERFSILFDAYVDRVKRLLRQRWHLAIIYIHIPDQAHHYFFPAVTDQLLLQEMINWYKKALETAKSIVEWAQAEQWMILSDHGLTSIVEEYEHGTIHHRDATVIGNLKSLPKTDMEVYETIQAML